MENILVNNFVGNVGIKIMDKISVFGIGFIGSKFCKLYPNDTIPICSDQVYPESNVILMTRSTTDNYGPPELNISINNTQLVRVLRNLSSKKRFVFLSSWFVYDANLELPVKESAPTGALGYYSASKSFAEKLVQTYCLTNKIPFNIIRLCNVIGPGDNYSKKKNALTWLIKEIQAGRDVNLYHGGDIIRDYLEIDQICQGIKFIIDNGADNEIYNLGSGVPYKMIDLLDYVRDRVNSKSQFHSIEPPELHNIIQTRNFYMDTSKLKDLGFFPCLNVFNTLDKIIESSI